MTDEYIPNMVNKDEVIRTSNKKCDFVLVVDINNRINGETVNEAIGEIIINLKRLQVEVSQELDIVISIITFAGKAECKVEQTMIMDYIHSPIIFDGVQKSYTNAFDLLNEKLTRKQFMAHTGKIAQPYILFITDGLTEPDDDYTSKLDALYENGWFTHSQRFAVLIGEDAINSTSVRNAVSKFVSNPDETIIKINEFVEIIKSCCPIHIGPGVHFPSHETSKDVEITEEEMPDFGGFGCFDIFAGDFDDWSFI